MSYSIDAIQRPNNSRNVLNRMLAQPYTSLVLLGSLLLSAASFFTTYSGMIDFTEHWMVNFCVVFAIQGLLFVTSWRIGFAVAERERLPLFTVFVFLICLATSVFFSFAALNHYVNDEETRERKRVARMHAAVDSVNAAIAQRLVETRIVAIDAMLAAPAFDDWERALDAVGESALGARAAITQARDAAAEEITAEIARLEEDRRAIRAEQAASSARLGTLQERLSTLEGERPALVELIGTLRAEIQDLSEQIALQEGLMRAEEEGSVSGTGAGRGPAWRDLRDRRNILVAQREAKDRALLDAQARLDQLDRDIAAVSADIAVADGRSGDDRVAVVDGRIAELRARASGGAGGAGGGSLAGDVDAMRAALAAFKSRREADLTDFDRTIALCGEIVGELRANPALRDGAVGLACEPEVELAALVSRSRTALREEAAFAAQCARGGAEPPLSQRGFDDAANFGLECIERFAGGAAPALGVSNRQDELRSIIERTAQDEDPNTTRYERAVSEFMIGDKLAYSAAAIALFIDILVLFSGLIGALSASGKLQLALGRILTKSEIEDFERALRPTVASFILTEQQALKKPLTGAPASRKLRYSARIDLDRANGMARTRAQARAFLIAQKGRGLVTASRPDERATLRVKRRKDAPFDAAGEETSNVFWLSDELMRGLRAYLENPESHRLDGLPLAGAMSDDDRRRAAREITRFVRPYSGGWRKVGDWPYVGRVKLDKIDASIELTAHSKLRENATQIMTGLCSLGMARLKNPRQPADDADDVQLDFLVKDSGLELLDRAARLSEAEEQFAMEDAQEAEEARRRERQRQKANAAEAPQPRLPTPERAALEPPREPTADAEAESSMLSLGAEDGEPIERAEPRARRPAPDVRKAENVRADDQPPAGDAPQPDRDAGVRDTLRQIGLQPDRVDRLKRDGTR